MSKIFPIQPSPHLMKTGSPPDFLWKSGGRPMSFKGGNFSFQARTAQNWLRMVKYGTYLELNTSQEAPKHCPTFDSLTQCFASAHFRSPPVRLQFRSPSNFVCHHIPSLISLQIGLDFSPNWRRSEIGGAAKLEAHWRRPKMSTSKALS